MQSKQVKPLLYETYLAVIRNSVGAKIFRNFYAKIGGKKIDIMKNGKLSCAFFVSSILSLFKLAQKPHGTVDGTVKDMKKHGWTSIKKIKIGSVIVWEQKKFGKEGAHKHIGFYIGNGKAISNSTKSGSPAIHHPTFGTANGKPKRKIEAIYWNNKLN
jgi:hypothetical protein